MRLIERFTKNTVVTVPMTPNKRILELGETVLIDLNEVSAVYREGSILVVRIGGMGVIRLEKHQLHGTIQAAYDDIKDGLK